MAPAAAPPRHNLPAQITSLVGREQDVADVDRLLSAARLVTLTGPGGIGKTRLALEVATGAAARFRDGAWLVELAALADAALVPQAVATALGVREETDRPLAATLAEALGARQALLLLDNCEHLIEACAALADALLRACPALRILATSRQPLGISGEATYRVPPLSLASPTGAAPADPTGPSAPADARSVPPTASAAAHLFLERARAVQPAFALTDRNVGAVEQICRRLDGLPLAIELAAARVAALGPEQITARLGDRFRLLTGGSRTALPRYRTLRALIDWSHDLLDEPERILLRRLASFVGGWTLEAAEAVCAGDGLASDEILDLLSGLVTKSLVLTDEHGDETRYGFLESLREYATEKLRDAGEDASLRRRHRDWFLELAERAEPALDGPDSARWFGRLERERENLRAALGWCIEHDEVEPGLRLGGALTRFWEVRGPYREVRGVLADLLASPAAHEPAALIQAARAKALVAAAWLAMRQDNMDMAETQCREALEISRRLGDRRGQAIATFSIGHIARVRGNYPVAQRLFAESAPVFEGLREEAWLTRVHLDLGVAAYFQGDLATAREQYEAALALSERRGDQLEIVAALNELGEVALLQGEHEQARSRLGASLELAGKIDDHERIAMTLAAFAGLAAAQSQPERALRLVAAATALNEATGQRNSPAWHALVERWIEPARQDLGAEASAAALAAGRAMALEESVAYALATDRSGGEPEGRAATGASGRAADPLTAREREVAALVARGFSNRQIAEALVIGVRTAESHVAHIMDKLGLSSRAQVAAWAVQHELLLADDAPASAAPEPPSA